jgi:hypothetical protein
MYNNTMLSEILKLLPRTDIQKITHKYQGDRYTKTFTTWDHLVAMITGQLAGVTSLRELELTLNSHPQCHYHMHTKSLKRSTLSDAQRLPLEKGRIYIFDKGYCDYKWWRAVADKESIFVTRLKKNAAYKVMKSFEIADEDKDFVLKHQTIILSDRNWHRKRGKETFKVLLQLIEIQHPNGKEEPFMIVTNDLHASAQHIAG